MSFSSVIHFNFLRYLPYEMNCILEEPVLFTVYQESRWLPHVRQFGQVIFHAVCLSFELNNMDPALKTKPKISWEITHSLIVEIQEATVIFDIYKQIKQI